MKALVVLGIFGLVGCGATVDDTSGSKVESSVSDAGRAATDGGQRASSDSSVTTAVDAGRADSSCSATTDEGDPCAVEGAFCKTSPCTDACSFCNTLRCGGGKWERMEAFPMPDAYCADVACGTAICGKGEFCVRTHSGPQPAEGGSGVTEKCAKLPSNCMTCACAEPAACGAMSSQCTPDPDSKKPTVDCYAQ